MKNSKLKNIKLEAKRALNQIEENRYETLLKRKRISEIIKIGMVFDKKRVEFKNEEF